MRFRMITALALVFALTGAVAFAQHGMPKAKPGAMKPPAKGGMAAHDKMDMPQEIKDIMKKFQETGKLTEEEKATMQEFTGKRGKKPAAMPDMGDIPDDIKPLIAKMKAGKELTDEDQAKLAKFAEQRKARSPSGMGHGMPPSKPEMDIPDELKPLIAKMRAGKELTDEDKAKLAKFNEQRKPNGMGGGMPEDLKPIIARMRAGKELTEEEKTKLKALGDKMNKRPGAPARPGALPAVPDEIKQIIKKQREGIALTAEEKTKLKAFHKQMRQRMRPSNMAPGRLPMPTRGK